MNNIDDIKKYESEGIEGLAKAFKESPIVMRFMDSSIPVDRESLKTVLMMSLLADSRVDNRFRAVSTFITLDAVINKLLSPSYKQDECKATDFLQEAVNYFRESRYYKAWQETSDGTESGLSGTVLIAYMFDRKFNSLCREAGINNSSEATRIIINQLLEQENKEE